MDAADRPTFEQAFTRMARAFRLKLKPAELEDLTSTYFKILEGAELADVLTAGKKCLEHSRTFPRPADWFQALSGPAKPADVDCRTMAADELVEYHRAERLRYQDDPCGCLGCQLAGVTLRPLRFVPDFTLEGEPERAFDNERNRLVHVGHWAHGDELARWYAARAAFFESVPRSSPMARALAVLVPQCREPGEEG